MVMVSPSASGDLLRSSTSQLRAMSCIQVPASETIWPTQNSR